MVPLPPCYFEVIVVNGVVGLVVMMMNGKGFNLDSATIKTIGSSPLDVYTVS